MNRATACNRKYCMATPPKRGYILFEFASRQGAQAVLIFIHRTDLSPSSKGYGMPAPMQVTIWRQQPRFQLAVLCSIQLARYTMTDLVEAPWSSRFEVSVPSQLRASVFSRKGSEIPCFSPLQPRPRG